MDTGPIFLSYARRDGQPFVERLEKDLTAAGYKTWHDQRNLNEYNDFSAEIEIAIRASSYVAVCVTPSVEQNPSSFVRREIIYAQTKQKPIIPLVFPDADVPVLINNLTWIPFFEGHELRYETGFQKLLERLNESLKPSTPRSGVEDPFHAYLTQLYEWIVAFLDQSVFSLITLGSESVANATQGSENPLSTLPLTFLNTFALTAGIKEKGIQPSVTTYPSFPEAFSAYDGRVLLLGDAGSGQTTTLMAFAREAIVKRLENRESPLPLLAPIATWDADAQPSIADWLGASIPSLKNALLELIQAGQALLLLDGLDELGTERPVNPEQPDGETFDPRQVFIQYLPPQNQILLTCRIADYEAIGEKVFLNGAVRLQPLTDTQIRTYLEPQPELWEILQRDEQLKELARTPLLLSLVTFAFADMASDLATIQGLSRSDLADKIFEAYLHRRYAYEKRKPFVNLPYSYEKMIALLRCCAVTDAMGEGQNTLEILYINQCVGYEPDVFIEQVVRLHIFVPTLSTSTFRFIHLLLRNYLAFPELLAHLEPSHTEWRRRKAASVLGDFGDQRALPALSKALLTDSDVNVRRAAAEWLGKIGDSTAVDALIQALDDERARVRGTAAQSLSIIGDARAVKGLVKLAQDGDKVIRLIAIDAIAALADPEAVDALIDALSNSNPAVCQAASDALLQIGDPAVAALVGSLNNSQSNTRHWAAFTLGKLRAEVAIPDLVRLLADATPISFVQHVSDTAAEALQRIGTPTALAALEQWQQGRDTPT